MNYMYTVRTKAEVEIRIHVGVLYTELKYIYASFLEQILTHWMICPETIGQVFAVI